VEARAEDDRVDRALRAVLGDDRVRAHRADRRPRSALADEAVRLALTDPERYGDERILRLAEWVPGRLA
jgi:hypothetical protein